MYVVNVIYVFHVEIPEIHDGVEVLSALNSWKTLTIPFSSLEYKPKDVFLAWRIDAEEGELITFYVSNVTFMFEVSLRY